MLQRIASLLRETPPITDDRGLLRASGATVPTDETDGYQPGCIFQDTTNGIVYVNEGSVTSCDFNAVEAGSVTSPPIILTGNTTDALTGGGIQYGTTAAEITYTPASTGSHSGIQTYITSEDCISGLSIAAIRTRVTLTGTSAATAYGAQFWTKIACTNYTGHYLGGHPVGCAGIIELAGTARNATSPYAVMAGVCGEVRPVTTTGNVDVGGVICGLHAKVFAVTGDVDTGDIVGVMVQAIGSGASDIGILVQPHVGASWTTGIKLDSGYGTITTGISIAACATAAVHILGDQAIGILCDVDASWTDALKISVDTSMTLSEGIEMSGAGTITTGITISATAVTTGIAISAGSLTDGIKISGATPADGVDVSSVCSGGAFHVSGTSASGLLISGACTTAAINITSIGIPMGLLYNVDMTTQIGANVEGIKVILERTADVAIGTSNILGAEFIIKQGSDSYAAGMAPQITGVRIAMGGANTKATVYGLKCETQSNGYVTYLGLFSVNDACTLASGGAVLYVRSYPTAAKLLKIEQPAATTATDGICLTDNVGTGTITNLITISARNSTFLFNFDYVGTGCVSSGSDSTNCTHKVAVNVGGGTRYLHLFSD